ncbi:hypothetical protein Dda_7640 [Drechslerella dactyloides]|uniref:PARP catalytic domain-containing protein n=1 Tax=Drechslerella dactyloides TaxID=74499 RepID=A0AAD6IW39_DREDA|nr:hypothetical protein Dda_7640 [Drechslerella dactyloides]
MTTAAPLIEPGIDTFHDEEQYSDYTSDSDAHSSSGSPNISQSHIFKATLESASTASLTFTDDELTELAVLRDEEIDRLYTASLIADSNRFDATLHDRLVFEYPEMTLTLFTGPSYPVTLPSYTIDNISLPRLVVDGIRIALRGILATVDDAATAHRWLTRADNEDTYGAFASDGLAFTLASTAHEHLLSYRAVVAANTHNPTVDIASASASRSQILASQLGVDPTSYSTPAAVQALLGNSIADICALLPREYRILHVENVIKPSLYAAFHAVQQNIRTRLLTLPTSQLRQCVPAHKRPPASTATSSILADRRAREALADVLVTPKCTFHGTQRHAIANIIRHGFLRPGDTDPSTDTPLGVRCGSTYGRGIYTSPSPRFSLLYSGYEAAATPTWQFSGLKLIVCATVMGRTATVTRADNWRTQSAAYPGADSHVANSGMEYVVFQPRQTIPVLVVHLDWGKEHYDEFASIPSDSATWVAQMRQRRRERREQKGDDNSGGYVFPADVVARKQALVARAKKWFPYGYGPATGTAFVVEAVADDEDDEEEYGEYQADKVEGSTKSATFWEMPPVDGEDVRFDEFFMERRAKTRFVEPKKPDLDSEE